jgi:predicted alpha/beta hydrolase
MKLLTALLIAWLPLATPSAARAQTSQPLPRVVELKASDGTPLKATYFAAAKPGPGVLLLHQSNRTRKAWDELAGQLTAAGINTLTLDMRGFGDSGSPYTRLTDAERAEVRNMWPGDVDTAWQYLISQPGVKRDVIGVGGAGWFGVLHSVEVARQHAAEDGAANAPAMGQSIAKTRESRCSHTFEIMIVNTIICANPYSAFYYWPSEGTVRNLDMTNGIL